MNETTERFFQEIATQVGYDRVVEVHLFPVIRQSGVEAAVAVVAAEPDVTPEAAPAVAPDIVVGDAPDAANEDALARGDVSADVAPEHVGDAEPARLVVYTARYRHTVKGTARGKWVVDIVAEADAPLVTVDAVVRGVVQRSGEAFQPERISGDQFRAIVPAPAALEPEPA